LEIAVGIEVRMTESEPLSQVRRSIRPEGNDTWETIAQRELADLPLDEAVSQLQSWNLHVFMRPSARIGSAREGNPVLPSDIIFLSPPEAP
jgi:hypothetical protein